MIAILGNGLMGSELTRQSGWDCFARKDGIEFTQPDTYVKKIAEYDQIVNCIGYTKTLQPDKEPAWSVNYTGVIDLVNFCNKHNKKLIHISTDFIYCGSTHPAKETGCPVHFNNWYTYSKLLADAHIQARSKDYLIIRTSYKARPFPYDKAFVLRRGNFDYVDIIAGLIIQLIERDATGVVNVGTEEKTMYDLARQTRNVRAAYNHVIPHDTTMDLTRMKSILNIY